MTKTPHAEFCNGNQYIGDPHADHLLPLQRVAELRRFNGHRDRGTII